MGKCYFEARKSAARGTDSVAADVMRHLHTRQHLGKAVVVCEQPTSMLSASRKQWLKLSRAIQKQRAATLNADKILKFTHTITNMQHMTFSMHMPLEKPDADVYFLRSDQLDLLPVHCWSVYVLTSLDVHTAENILGQLPSGALLIDYEKSFPWEHLGLQPKSVLESQVDDEWRQVEKFLRDYDIDIHLLAGSNHNVDAMDDALDTLLGVSFKFLQVAGEFQRSLELSRPLRAAKQVRALYDTFVLLAHRVQALSPNAFTQRFLETYNEDDTFFLYDRLPVPQFGTSGESLTAAFHRHRAAGRYNLADALLLASIKQRDRADALNIHIQY